MPLVDSLTGSFTAGGFNLTVTVDGMGDVLDAAGLDPAAFDPGALAEIVERLRNPDLGTLGALTEAAAGQLGGAVALVPGAPALLGPLPAALAVMNLSVADLPALGAAVAGADARTDATGLAALQPVLAAATGLVDHPGAVSVSGLLGSLVPGFDARAVGRALGDAGGGLAALVGVVGGLLAVESATRDLAGGIEVTASFLDRGRIRADLVRLEGWATTGALVDLLVGIDPDEPGVVDLVAGALLDYAATARRLSAAVVGGMAWGEATLAGLDVDGLVARIDAATAAVRQAPLGPVRDLLAELRARLEVVLSIELPTPPGVDDAVAGLSALAAQLAGAIDAVDPAQLARPLGDALETVVGPLRTIEAAAREAVAAARAALAAVRSAVTAVDLRPVTDAVAAVVTPVAEALDALEGLVAGAQAAVEATAGAVDGVLQPVRTTMATAASTLQTAFGAVGSAIDALGLDDVGSTLRAGADQVAGAIGAAQLRPVFDVATTALDATATALSLTPRDLLPDAVREELESACEALEAVDLSATRAALGEELDGIRESVDVGVLEALRQAHAAVVAFLASIDPRPPLTQVEDGPFADLVARLRAADPTTPLTPVIEAVDEARAAVAAFDPLVLLRPVEEALDAVTDALRELDPAQLLGPVEAQVAAAREAVTDALALDRWEDWLDAVSGAVDRFLARLDLAPIVAALDGAHGAFVSAVTGPPAEPGPLGTLVAALAEGAGVTIRADSLAEVGRWLSGSTTASSLVSDRLAGARATTEALATAVAATDLSGAVGRLAAHHDHLVAALEVHPPGSALRVRVDADLAASAPAELLGSVLVNRDRYLAGLRAAGASLSRLAAASLSELDQAAAGLRDAATALVAFAARARALITATTGVPTDGRSINEALADVLGRITPSVVLAPVATAVEGLRDRARAAVETALIGPLRAALTSVEELITALDLAFVREELTAARDDVISAVDGLRPTTLLGPVLAEVEQLRNRVAGFDPLGPVRAVVDGLRGIIDQFEADFRPTAVAAPALDVYDRAVAAIAGIAIDDVLAPVLAALDQVQVQLEDGMDRLTTSLAGVQDACASGGPSLGAALGAAAGLIGAVAGGGVSVDVSVGGGLGL